MFAFEEDAHLVEDREDLLALLHIRFGKPPPGVIHAIYAINELDTLQRLILTAANAPEWKVFLEELREGSQSFRITGERFNPVNSFPDKGDSHGHEG
jgi:hypothetical protein